VQRMVDDDLNS